MRLTQVTDNVSVNDISVEYAHIYTDQQFSRQHELGLKELAVFLASVQPKKSVNKVVLIDDYSPAISLERFNMNGFLSKLEEAGEKPEIVVLESAITGYCERTLGLISDKKLHKRVNSYYLTRGKYPCSLFVASWYLLRLGAFGEPDIKCVIGNARDLLANNLVTILPDSFTTPEEQAIEIIKNTPFADLANKVQHIMFEHQEVEYSDWQLFDAEEYVERNYGHAILPEDRQIIEFVVGSLEALKIEPKSLQNVADIGVGPNLYPALLLSPYIADRGSLELIDYAQSNLDYLTRVLRGGDLEDLDIWLKFEQYIKELGLLADIRTVEQLGKPKKGNIFELPKNHYEAVLSFFVSDSITDDDSTFVKATASLMNSLKPNGLFIIAHMVGSHGYFAGERTFFPAVDLTIEEIESEYSKYGTFQSYLVTHENQQAVRKGYKGMAVVVGKRNE